MGLGNDSGSKKTVLIVQCRLSSTRLPEKALLPLGGKTVLEWNLEAMSKVEADERYLATDGDSFERLKPYAEKCGFRIFEGSRDDVLDRFCRVIELSSADIVIRATADNPFLFYEAANDLAALWKSRAESEKIDYMTYSGLPHGSGVEMFNAHSLMEAARKTDLPYDHEHVGPALYAHPESFRSVFEPAPEKYMHPKLRTTIDTSVDYIRARKIVDLLSEKGFNPPYSCSEIVGAFEKPSISNPVILIPSVEKGHGTGHLHRCLDLAVENGWDVYIPSDASLEQCKSLVDAARERGLKDWQIVEKLEWLELYSLAVVDMFSSPQSLL
ncbi:MAG: acylneuraminate cytidylyltransferase, partial [Treponema sp.]|nr:acylneuraminate cytidylyltransferase [Treponema sp.]